MKQKERPSLYDRGFVRPPPNSSSLKEVVHLDGPFPKSLGLEGDGRCPQSSGEPPGGRWM